MTLSDQIRAEKAEARCAELAAELAGIRWLRNPEGKGDDAHVLYVHRDGWDIEVYVGDEVDFSAVRATLTPPVDEEAEFADAALQIVSETWAKDYPEGFEPVSREEALPEPIRRKLAEFRAKAKEGVREPR